jgi:hypothetical protein
MGLDTLSSGDDGRVRYPNLGAKPLKPIAKFGCGGWLGSAY